MSGFYRAGAAACTSMREDWETPQALFERLDAEWHFDLDAAATPGNAKCERYLTPADDALSVPWGGVVFCNPPYGRELRQWVEKARGEADSGRATVVMLIPARTDTSYWHDLIFGRAEVEFLRGRVRFELDGVPMDSAPFPSAVVTFERRQQGWASTRTTP